jgi:hypothetical protein
MGQPLSRCADIMTEPSQFVPLAVAPRMYGKTSRQTKPSSPTSSAGAPGELIKSAARADPFRLSPAAEKREEGSRSVAMLQDAENGAAARDDPFQLPLA